MTPFAGRFALATLALVLLVAGAALAAKPKNPADKLSKLPIDTYRYDYAKKCLKTPTKGARTLERWLGNNIAGQSWGIMRCEKWGRNSASLHAEGRAIDWRLDAAIPAQKKAADAFIKLLLATDKAGNHQALARRMGIQEIIYNCRSWWSGDHGMRPYSVCYTGSGKRKKGVDRTSAHKDHIHLGVSWSGARLQTSFWKHQ